jgi:hypothetical protein
MEEEALRMVNEIEGILDEYKKKPSHLPNVSIIVHQIKVFEPIPGTCYMLTVLSVRNTGAPSIVDNWMMTFDDYPEQKVQKINFTEDIVFPVPNQVPFVYHRSDQLPDKVAENPVPPGGKRVGFILWKLPGFDPKPIFDNAGISLHVTVRAKDVVGNLIVSENKTGKRDDKSLHYPGLQTPASKPDLVSGQPHQDPLAE